MSQQPRILLAGGTGFLGQALLRYFTERGAEVVVLSRRPRPPCGSERYVHWDGQSAGEWTRHLEGATAVINLAGQSVNCRYHRRNRRRIMDSRVASTRALGAAIAHCARPPHVWLNSGTATIYRHNFGAAWDESGVIGAHADAKDAFSIAVASAWEKEFQRAITPATRKVVLRSAMVLGPGRNSVFPVLRRLARWGLGGPMGSGQQYVSWIHQRDFCRALRWLIEQSHFGGVVNVAAPCPLSNAEMMRTLRQVCGVSFGLPAAAWMLEVGAFFLRTETELILKSRRVIPGRLLAEGFQFDFPCIREAFEDLARSPAA